MDGECLSRGSVFITGSSGEDGYAHSAKFRMVALSQWSEINRYEVHYCLRVFFLEANKTRLGEDVIDGTDSGIYGYERRGKAEQGSEMYEMSNIPFSALRNLAV